ncbi:deoxyribonuclease [Oenococcus kitaharae DSM 17330]|uniref:Deoxyribonuclease n=2 Tax=Oenococcus kitaharae TaxID=336988 RepID=G9WHA0_9LACO|nr:deoxyribonuclease [Oenococcus kitaharae DSM 17330]
MLFLLLFAIVVLGLCCLPAFRAGLKARRIHVGLVVFASLILLAFSFSAFSGGHSDKAVHRHAQTAFRQEADPSETTVSSTASSSSQASKQASSQAASSTSSVVSVVKDENHDFQGFVQKPLPFRHQKQLQLASLDALGRARDSHIQLRNSDEPAVKREPYLNYDPAGWHNYRFFYRSSDGQTKMAWLMNRGHLVGYQFSGLNDEGRNLVAETAWLNTGNYVGTDVENTDSMLFYEEGLDNWLSLHPDYYLDYQVTPLYQGSELVPRQVRLAYVGIDSQGRTLPIILDAAKEQEGNGDARIVYLNNQSPNAKLDYQSGQAVNTVPNGRSQAAAISSSKPAASPNTSADPHQRIVYVTGDGRSPVYWYSEDAMPSNTNKSRVIQMTEQQALDQHKRHSKTEP